MTRPVYPYAAAAVWTSHGDVHDAADWTRGAAPAVVTLTDWPGRIFFEPYPFVAR